MMLQFVSRFTEQGLHDGSHHVRCGVCLVRKCEPMQGVLATVVVVKYSRLCSCACDE